MDTSRTRIDAQAAPSNGKKVRMQTPWDHRYAHRTQRMKGSAIRELLKFTELPDVISFAGGLPAPDVFPVKEFKEACNLVLDTQGAQALQYGTTEGYTPLREMIARHNSRLGINTSPENILITSGSQQALDLMGRIFINRGDRVLVESPTYLGALQAWNAYGAEYVPVATDQHGMIPEALEAAMRFGPKFIYVLPNFQNPTGITVSLERRKHLVETAERYGVPIVEDDPYGQLRFEGKHIPAVKVLDAQMRGAQNGTYCGNVIYTSTFSKILAPGIRLAWVVAPSEVIRKLVMAKQGADLNTAVFNQMVAYEVGRHGFLDKHSETIVRVYRERRNVMLDSLEEFMPPGVTWTRPSGGLFLWATLPEEIDTTLLLEKALQRKVAFVPGESFYPDGSRKNNMRLNFSYSNPELIVEGISRLGETINDWLGA